MNLIYRGKLTINYEMTCCTFLFTHFKIQRKQKFPHILLEVVDDCFCFINLYIGQKNIFLSIHISEFKFKSA